MSSWRLRPLPASFLGQPAFRHPHPRGLAILALAAFVFSIAASVFILLPKKNLIFAEAGAGLYEGLYSVRDDMPEVFRRLAYELDRFWESNDKTTTAGAPCCGGSLR